MIRVLFVVLAVVAIALAVVLQRPMLYLVALGLLAGAAVILTATLRRRHRQESEVVQPVAAPEVADLRSLGIVEIRQKGRPGEAPSAGDPGAGTAADTDASASSVAPAQDAPAQSSSSETESDGAGTGDLISPAGESGSSPATRPAQDVQTAGGPGTLFGQATASPSKPSNGKDPARWPEPSMGAVRKRSRSARILVEGVSESYEADVMLSVLRGLRAATEATTVCLLRQESKPLAYAVEAIVSRNAFARNGGRFLAPKPLLAGHATLVPVVKPCNGAEGYDARRLGYYHEAIAIHQVAFVPLAAPDGRGAYLLVADSMAASGLEREGPTRQLTDFARLIQSLVAGGAGRQAAASPAGEVLRTRREIIAEEMEKARSEQKPLALALVYLNRAEAIGRGGDGGVREAETAFRNRLKAATTDGRIERFGELTFGIFRRSDADNAASWASKLQVRMAAEGGSLAGGVSVGIAMLGDRHDGPDQLRSDATDALRESYETGECIILE